MYNDTHVDALIKESKGNMTGAVIEVTSKTLELFIGISYVSIANAKLNLYKETNSLINSFDFIKDQSRKIW